MINEKIIVNTVRIIVKVIPKYKTINGNKWSLTALLYMKTEISLLLIPFTFKSLISGYHMYADPTERIPAMHATIIPFKPEFSPRYLLTISGFNNRLVKNIKIKTISRNGSICNNNFKNWSEIFIKIFLSKKYTDAYIANNAHITIKDRLLVFFFVFIMT